MEKFQNLDLDIQLLKYLKLKLFCLEVPPEILAVILLPVMLNFSTLNINHGRN